MMPAPPRTASRTYVFPVDLVAEDDGRFSISCPSIEGCVSWGRTRDEALASMREVVRLSLDELRGRGIPIPSDVQVVDAQEVVTLTI